MNHAEWLRTRKPEALPALLARITSLFAANPAWESLPHPEAFCEASDVLLRRVLEGDATERACSLDLLAADACVTYAFEAAADEPRTIVERAVRSKRRIAAVATEFSPASRQQSPA